MRVLWLIQSYEIHAFDVLADALSVYADVDVVRLSSVEQDNLDSVFKALDFNAYDRVMTTLRTKKEMRQWRTMRAIPNLVIFEYDACQNYLKSSKYRGKFSLYYRRLGCPRLIVSGSGVAQKLKSEGFDAHFIPKGYDARLIVTGDTRRDIELGFIGSLSAKVYRERKLFIERLIPEKGLQILRTDPGEAYGRALARIRIFVSADIMLGEYMAKNFEAMAAGCVLMTYDQGVLENQSVGFIDMHNVVLFSDANSFDEKLDLLKANPDLLDKISRNGAAFAREYLAYDRMGSRLAAALEKPLQPRMSKVSCRDWLGWW